MYFSGTTTFIITLIAVATSLAATPALLLTPLLKLNKTEQAKEASSVSPENFLNITSYSGFLTVDERYNSNLFFWYFPVFNHNVSTTPWIIWLQGGPGATSLAGLFVEIGPFKYDNGLKKREVSWCDEYSMVFIDNPVGAGFSFTDSDEGFVRNMEMYSENLYSAVKQLTRVYPELGTAPLYIAGESYAGRYVPALAMKILQGKDNNDNSINLQGLIMGNPVLDRTSVVDFTSVFYNWGLVDAQGALAAKPLQEKYEHAVLNGDNAAAYDLRNEVLDKLQQISYQNQLYNVLKNTDRIHTFDDYINRPDVKELLHVGDIDFTFSNATVHTKLIPDFLSAVSPQINNLLEHYKILIYCGQLDLTAPCVPNAEARRKVWQWSRRDEFLKAPRHPWWFNNTVAGYVKSGGGFTEVQINGAGHLAPMDKPVETKKIVYNFIKGDDFPIPTDYDKGAENLPNYIEYTDLRTSEAQSNSFSLKSGLIASVVVNVLLLVGIVVGAVMVIRWKRQHDYFNLPFSDDVLSLT